MIGPSLGPSSVSPEAMKRSMAGFASSGSVRWAAARCALTEKTKSAGTASPQARKVFGVCVR